MKEFRELLSVDMGIAINFFFANLEEVMPSRRLVSQDETLYVASVLAHWAATSRAEEGSFMPPMPNLSEVFDTFVVGMEVPGPDLLEVAGAQTLLLAGFFRDHMRGRYPVRWYDTMGTSFYAQAGDLSKDPRRSRLFMAMAVRFPFWTVTCRNLHRHLTDNRYLLST